MAGEKKWRIAPNRFLRREDLKVLVECAHRRRVESQKASRVLEHMVLEIALGSGLRVAEIVDINCGDMSLGKISGSIFVRHGKGDKSRLVIISGRLCRLINDFIGWKRARGESIEATAPLIQSSHTRSHLSTRALQKMFKRVVVAAKIAPHRFHDLRHTYATFLLKSSKNDLIFVRDQLGHADLATTAVYCHALNAEKAVNALYS